MVLEGVVHLPLYGDRAAACGPVALFSTFSIVARDGRGLLGVATASRALAVGARVAHARPNVAVVATQAYANPYLALDLLHTSSSTPLGEAASALLDRDPGQEWRQLIAIRPTGSPYAFTGTRTEEWAGDRVGDDYAIAGNMLVDERTVGEMARAFNAAPSLDLPHRLVVALEAGQVAGGDRRGRQSAAVLVVANEELPYVDLRVDDHSDPIAELRRLLELLGRTGLERARREASTRVPRGAAELAEQQRQLHEGFRM